MADADRVSAGLPDDGQSVSRAQNRLLPVAMILLSAVISNLILVMLLPRGDWNEIGETPRVSASIATGHGFSNPYRQPTGPSALLPPVYVCLLAGIFRVFGVYTVAAYWAAVALNIAFHALACVTLFWSAGEAFGHRTAWYSALALATFPLLSYPLVLMHIVGGFLNEGLFISPNVIWNYFLLELAIVILILLTLRRVHWAVYGVAWGISVLVDPNVVSMAPAFLAWQLWHRERRRHAVLTTLVAIVCFTPWLIRNYLTFHHLFFIRDNFGLELRVGNQPGNWGNDDDSNLHPEFNQHELSKVVKMGEFKYCKVAGQEAVDSIRAHPKGFVFDTLMRVTYSWFGSPVKSRRLHAFRFVKYLPQSVFSLLAFCGVGLALRLHNRKAILFIAVLFFCPLVHYLTHIEVHYQWPIQPEMLVLAVSFVLHILYNQRRRNAERQARGNSDDFCADVV